MTYPGLHTATLVFLGDLEANNDRDWFATNRDRYERYWLSAGLDLIAVIGPLLGDLRPSLQAVPKLNHSLRRIHRDFRFSADKRPFDPCLHIILSTDGAFNKVPGFHFVIRAQSIAFGAGHYGLSPDRLDAIRRRICDPADRADLLAALGQAAATGSDLDPPDLARVPNGYESAPEWDQLLRRKSMIARTQLPLPVPDWLFGPEAPRRIAQLAAAHVPLLAWLLR
jgi:uncharacterized protein (TIGR02453 family)